MRFGGTLFLACFVGFPAVLCASCKGKSGCEYASDQMIKWQNRCGVGNATTSDAVLSAKSRAIVACTLFYGAPGTAGSDDANDRCGRELEFAACSAPPRSCNYILGTAQIGHVCIDGTQCQSGVCTPTGKPQNGVPSYCGVCAMTNGANGQCKTSQDCDPGLVCVGAQPQMMMAGVCTASAGKPGDPCTASRECTQPNHCDLTAMKCAAPVVENGACKQTADCVTALVCSRGYCTTPTGNGGACSGGDCIPSYSCDTEKTKRCVPAIYAGSGEMCDGGITVCKQGQCSNGKCPVILADGAMCDPMKPDSICDYFATCWDGKCQIPDFRKCQ